MAGKPGLNEHAVVNAETGPTSADIQWRDIEGLFEELGAEVTEREDSRLAVVLFDEVRVFHRPHPLPNTDIAQ